MSNLIRRIAEHRQIGDLIQSGLIQRIEEWRIERESYTIERKNEIKKAVEDEKIRSSLPEQIRHFFDLKWDIKLIEKIGNISGYESIEKNLRRKNIGWFKNIGHDNYVSHRDNDLPAILRYANMNRDKSSEPEYKLIGAEWFQNDIPYRDGDKPVEVEYIFWGDDGICKWRKIEEIWVKNGHTYLRFFSEKFISLQIMIKYLYFTKKNKMAFHPNNLVGKLIKQDLYKMLEKK